MMFVLPFHTVGFIEAVRLKDMRLVDMLQAVTMKDILKARSILRVKKAKRGLNYMRSSLHLLRRTGLRLALDTQKPCRPTPCLLLQTKDSHLASQSVERVPHTQRRRSEMRCSLTKRLELSAEHPGRGSRQPPISLQAQDILLQKRPDLSGQILDMHFLVAVVAPRSRPYPFQDSLQDISASSLPSRSHNFQPC